MILQRMIGEEFALVLARAKHGDEESFERLWRDLNPALIRYLRVAGEPADDVAAETWTTVVKGLGRFRGDENAWRAWVFTTARRRAVDAARRRSREAEVPVATVDPADPDSGRWPSAVVRDSAEEALEAMDTDAALRLVAALPPLQAEVVMLRVVGGLPVDAVARLLGRSPGAVRVAAHRGLKQLGQWLAPPDATPAASPRPATSPRAAARPTTRRPQPRVTLQTVPALRK